MKWHKLMKLLSCLFPSLFTTLIKTDSRTASILEFHVLASCHHAVSFTLLLLQKRSSDLLEIWFDSAPTAHVSSQRHRARRESVPSRTSSSSGRWREWRGVKAGSPQRTPPSDVPRAATVLACGRKVLQAKCDWSNKVQETQRDTVCRSSASS